MEKRRFRYEQQAFKLRDAIRQAMEVAELKKMKTPAATLSLKSNPPAVRIYDEEVIPMAFMVQPPLKPDRKKIKEALEDGQDVPGADLSNQPESLSVRFT